MPLKRVLQWLKKFEKYLFYYEDGFFVLPYLNNTPALMVESFRSMPFVSQDPKRNILYSNNPFTKGVLHYYEVEAGLWLLVSELEFKANVRTKAVYDNVPSDYYFLAFSMFENPTAPGLEININNQKIKNNSWAIYRPGVSIDAFHLKGTKGLFFNFAFSQKWVNENFSIEGFSDEFILQKLLKNELGYLSWEGLLQDANLYALEIWKGFSEQSEQLFSKLKLKINTLAVLKRFLEKIETNQEGILGTQDELGAVSIKKIEQILLENLKNGFPGIEVLAEKINMSPSKLKSNFKKTFKMPPFQFYRNEQMKLAMKMLIDGEVQIKNVALYFGYENPSKFSNAFKKVHGMLPSEVLSYLKPSLLYLIGLSNYLIGLHY